MARTKKFTTGDLVRYTSKFRQSTGMTTGAIDGIVVGAWPSMGPIIIWSHRDWPIAVNAVNVEKKKTKRTRDELLAAARLTMEIPIGKPGRYRTYTGRPGKLKLRSTLDDKADALRRAELAYDQPGTGNIIVLDPDGSVILSLDAYYGGGESNPKGDRMKSKRGQRKPNTHDLARSVKNFEAALGAAERDLLGASGSIEKGNVGSSIKQLVSAGYWTGRARAEREYAGWIDKKSEKRLQVLEDGMKQWGKNFQDWMRKNAA